MPRLPDGYTEVEYIESTVPAYMDTGLKPTTTIKFVMDVEPTVAASTTTAASTTDKYFVTASYTSGTSRWRFSLMWNSSGVQVLTGYYSGSALYKTLDANTEMRRMILTVDYPNREAFVDEGSKVALTNVSTSANQPTIRLLNTSYGNEGLAAKLYSCRIWVGDELSRDFVPCINPSGAVGLFDLVGETFYGNANTTGSFTAGPEAVPYIITVTAEPSDAGTPAVMWSDDKTSVTVSQTAAEGYRFQGYYSATDELLSADSDYTFEPTEDVEITAKYAEIPRYIISASASPTAAGTVSGGGVGYEGEETTVTASASNHGYVFLGWQKDGATVSTDLSFTFTVTENVTLTAQYELDESLKKYRFSSWQENGEIVSTDQSYTFQAVADRHLTAKFELIPICSVTVRIGDEQADYGTASGGGAYREGESVTVTAAPSEGHGFVAWRIDSTTVSRDEEYTFTVSADITLVAVFKVGASLPKDYTPLEYIQSTAPAYIDTGLNATATTKLVIDVEPTAEPNSTAKYIMSSYYIYSSTSRFEVWMFESYWSSSGIYARTGYLAGTSVNVYTAAKTLTSNAERRRRVITIDCQARKGYVDDEPEVTLYGATSVVMPIKLLSTGTASEALAAKLYSCQIWKAGELVRDLVPCIAPSGAVGLYDLAEGAFYANANTAGSFSAGPAV